MSQSHWCSAVSVAQDDDWPRNWPNPFILRLPALGWLRMAVNKQPVRPSGTHLARILRRPNPRQRRKGGQRVDSTSLLHRQGTGSLTKALRILSEIGFAEPDALRLNEVVSRTGIEPSTAYRMLGCLTDEGFLERIDGKRYRLGRQIFELGLAAGLRYRSGAEIRPILDRLARQLDTPVLLNIRSGAETVYIEREGPELSPGLIAAVGKRVPIGVGAGGVAILAHMAPTDVDRLIRSNERRYRDFGHNTSVVLRRLVNRARTDGFAHNVSFQRPDIGSIGVVVPNPSGTPNLSISILLHVARLNDAPMLAHELGSTAHQLSTIMMAQA